MGERAVDDLEVVLHVDVAGALVRRHHHADDFAVRAWAGAVVGVVMATYEITGQVNMKDYLEIVDRAFTQLAAGLPLGD